MQLRTRKKPVSQLPSAEIKTEKKADNTPKDDFDLFKELAKKHAPHKPRTSSPYKDNFTAGLAWRDQDAKALYENEKNPAKLLELCEDRIKEHAARRIDLFFYVLVSYYKTQVPPMLGWSKLQHGKGRINFKTKEAVTNAAHSSLASTMIDRTILKKSPLDSTIKKSNLKIKTSILCATHFMDSLNSTIELPIFVNDLDFHIETIHQGMKKSEEIIQEVAAGKINPIAGLLKFLLLLQNIFDDMLANKDIFTSRTVMSLETKKQLVELEQYGTFINKLAKDGKSVNDNYIYMLLRLNQNEIAQCTSDPKKREKILDAKFMEMQKEIMTTPSAHIKTPSLR